MQAGEQGPPASALPEIDKVAMGQRIKRLRQEAGLRQWELARRLGTTQSAVHKYEHGVVPEPRRLLELARIGSTSVEWILTGRHWENGSEQRERVSSDLLRTASLLRQLDAEERVALERALGVLREAVAALREVREGAPEAEVPARHEVAPYGEDTLRVLDAAVGVQRAVLRRLARQAAEDLRRGVGSAPQDDRTPDGRGSLPAS